MKKEIIIERALKTATDIYFTELALKKIAYVDDCNWVKKEKASQENFDKEIKEEKRLYKKLRKYKDELFVLEIVKKEISKEEGKQINNEINNFISGLATE